jgi:tetratricopeptide (TPR) repeat protein
MNQRLVVVGICLFIGACQSFREPLPPQPDAPQPVPVPVPTPTVPVPTPAPAPVPKQVPPAVVRQYRLGAAAQALVTQAQQQQRQGNPAAAVTTLERALRIEPNNPLLWLELSRVRLQTRDAAQTVSVARKALSLATGSRELQAQAWHLIAAGLRAQGRIDEAKQAELRARL